MKRRPTSQPSDKHKADPEAGPLHVPQGLRDRTQPASLACVGGAGPHALPAGKENAAAAMGNSETATAVLLLVYTQGNLERPHRRFHVNVPSSIIQNCQKLFKENLILKMSSFQYKITMYAKNQERMAFSRKKRLTETIPECARQGTKETKSMASQQAEYRQRNRTYRSKERSGGV